MMMSEVEHGEDRVSGEECTDTLLFGSRQLSYHARMAPLCPKTTHRTSKNKENQQKQIEMKKQPDDEIFENVSSCQLQQSEELKPQLSLSIQKRAKEKESVNIAQNGRQKGQFSRGG